MKPSFDVKAAEDLQLPTPDLVTREDRNRLPSMATVEASAKLQNYIRKIGRRVEMIQAR